MIKKGNINFRFYEDQGYNYLLCNLPDGGGIVPAPFEIKGGVK